MIRQGNGDIAFLWLQRAAEREIYKLEKTSTQEEKCSGRPRTLETKIAKIWENLGSPLLSQKSHFRTSVPLASCFFLCRAASSAPQPQLEKWWTIPAAPRLAGSYIQVQLQGEMDFLSVLFIRCLKLDVCVPTKCLSPSSNPKCDSV